jgi:competence ComEA-like helix-hairpin-helix protein
MKQDLRTAAVVLCALALASIVGARREAPVLEAGPRGGAVLPEGGRLDLNGASADDLVALPGIGAERARRIVRLRADRGGFGAVEDLLEVKGVGVRTLDALRPHVTVAGGDPQP